MTEPRYRFWGSHKPARIGVQAQAEAGVAQLRLYDPIDSWGAPWGVSAKEFAAALDDLGDVNQIELHVHSPGGDVFDGLAIMNQLRQHKAAVHVVVDGLAASAASYIAVGGGDTVEMAPNAQLMIHDAFGLALGTAADMETMRAALDKASQNIAAIYAAKAGGTADEWRQAMQPESWYTADEAVTAGLADRVTPSETQPQDRFDLSIFAYAGRDQAPAPRIPAAKATETPADQPAKPTEPEEADTMSDTIPKAGLCKALGLPADADEDAILDALDTKVKAAAEPPQLDGKAITDALAETGKVAVSQTVLDELRDMAQAGVAARQKQLAEERDEAIQAAFTAGKISAARREHWQAAWDKDPEGTRADLESLPARFPVAQAAGYAGSEETGADKPFTDDEADALGALAGLPKGALR